MLMHYQGSSLSRAEDPGRHSMCGAASLPYRDGLEKVWKALPLKAAIGAGQNAPKLAWPRVCRSPKTQEPTLVLNLDPSMTASPIEEALSTTCLLWLFSSSFCGFGEIKTSQKCDQMLQNWIEN